MPCPWSFLKISLPSSLCDVDLASIFATLMMLFLWLKLWFSQDQALIGVLFIAGVMPITFQNHYFQPWSLLEPDLFSGVDCDSRQTLLDSGVDHSAGFIEPRNSGIHTPDIRIYT